MKAASAKIRARPRQTVKKRKRRKLRRLSRSKMEFGWSLSLPPSPPFPHSNFPSSLKPQEDIPIFLPHPLFSLLLAKNLDVMKCLYGLYSDWKGKGGGGKEVVAGGRWVGLAIGRLGGDGCRHFRPRGGSGEKGSS